MKRKKSYLFIFVGVLAIILLTSLLKKNYIKAENNKEDYVKNVSGTNTSDVPLPNANFINSDGSVSKPDFSTFPEGYTLDQGEASNAAFHEISWQTFLWLTTELDNGTLIFEEFYNNNAINPNEENPRQHILGGIRQADFYGNNSVLVDQNSNPVYTTMMIDTIYRDFVLENKLYTVSGLENVKNTLNFPDGSISLKASWKILEDKDDPLYKTAYVVKDAKVYKPVVHNDKLTTSDEVYKGGRFEDMTFTSDVAMVGFHIAVVVKDHPEFIWATFEHNTNAPNFNPADFKDAYEQVVYDGDTDFTFYKNGTIAGFCNISNAGTNFTVDKNTNKVYVDKTPYKSQVFRRLEFGGGKESNQINIDTLNHRVYRKLSENSIWKNYFEVGAVWFNEDNGELEPNWSPTTNYNLMTGSTELANATIETFTQDVNNVGNNCFGCHNTVELNYNDRTLKGKNVLTSHILLQNYIDSLTNPKLQPVLVKRGN
ncbi:hypothetical protein [Aureivirga marina]|uniref:hypothetical protein n=1 Tax=Aureivirga marina TaxID=1182451 RepID=UPI0018C99BEE|nr:hypothetical protein [Aureivirga marina]